MMTNSKCEAGRYDDSRMVTLQLGGRMGLESIGAKKIREVTKGIEFQIWKKQGQMNHITVKLLETGKYYVQLVYGVFDIRAYDYKITGKDVYEGVDGSRVMYLIERDAL